MRNRVIICSSFEMVSIGLAEIVDSLAQFDVVSCLDSPEYLSEKILTTDANIVIIDPSVLGYQNKDFVFQFRKKHPHVTLIALVTTSLDHSWLVPYCGVIEINDTRSKIIDKMSEFVKNDKQKKSEDVELSKRETDVLIAIAKGMMNKEIADQMNLSVHTVISHRRNITRKTGIKSVSGLTVYALLNNLINEKDLI